MKTFDLSVIIPAFNEESRLPKTIESIYKYFPANKKFEIIVVDDGSTDNLSNALTNFPEVTLLTLPRNRGKGYAVRLGVLNARGENVLYADADGSAPIEELPRLESAINQGADIAIGSRAVASDDTHIEAKWYRMIMGRVFNLVANTLLVPGIKDTQCGFKLFRREVALKLFEELKTERFAFDVEILARAKKQGFIVKEISINWAHVPQSKINLFADSGQMFFDLIRIRLRL